MSELEKLARLKKKAATLQREADKAQGRLESLQAQLKEDFDCDTVKEAETLLEELEAEEKAAGKAFKKALAKFEKEWGEVLGG